MRAKWPWFLLAASLLLNAFFAGGVVYSKTTAEHLRDKPGARLDFVADELGLSDAERSRLSRSAREALLAEIAKPDFDQAQVEELLRRRSAHFVSFLSGVMSETHDFLATLDPEQKDAFVAMMQRERRFLWRLLREAKDERPGGS